MPRRYPDLIIEDMLECLDLVQEYSSQLPMESLLQSRLHKDAIIRNLEVLGEAANQLPDCVRALKPEIPWAQLISLRNKLIHEYHGINWDILIPIMIHDIPKLKQELEALKPLAPKVSD